MLYTIPLEQQRNHVTGGGWEEAQCHWANIEKERDFNLIGFYCVVHWFSSKEGKHCIVASVVESDAFGDVSMLGFENHLNVFHESKRKLHKALAHRLVVFLNTSAVNKNSDPSMVMRR